jgi:hypothetical protein
MKTVTVQADIPANRELRVILPDDVPTGPCTVRLEIGEPEARLDSVKPTLGELLDPRFFGIWADRDDITDSLAFARELRAKVERREL